MLFLKAGIFLRFLIIMHEIRNELLLDECVIQQGNRIVFLAVDDFRVTLCVPDGCMAEQLAGRVNVHPRRQGKGRESVPGDME